MAQKHIMPGSLTPAMDMANNRFSQAFHRYFAGLEEVSKRVAVNVAPLDASPTNAEIATAFNDLLDALQDASLQETS